MNDKAYARTEKEDKQYAFEDFTEIIRQLRGENGCPWDRAQTHQSLKKCLVDETNEVLEGIDIYEATGDWDNMCEELGDVLLQVVMHSVMAEEEGLFTIADVIQGISEKMIRRHPHVFGQAGGQEVALSWEEIKALEKAQKSSSFADCTKKP